MDDTIQITDESLERKYYACIPHIIDDLNLDPYAYRLYGKLKRIAGENGGICWMSTRKLAKACNMSMGKVSESKQALAHPRPELEGKSLIVIIKKYDEGRGRENINPRHHIILTDIWPENMMRYSQARSPGEQEQARSSPEQTACSQDEQTSRSPDERACSPGERSRITLLKKNPRTGAAVAAVAPAGGVRSKDPLTDAFRRTQERDALLASGVDPPEAVACPYAEWQIRDEKRRKVLVEFTRLSGLAPPTGKKLDRAFWIKAAGECLGIFKDDLQKTHAAMRTFFERHRDPDCKDFKFTIYNPGSIRKSLSYIRDNGLRAKGDDDLAADVVSVTIPGGETISMKGG